MTESTRFQTVPRLTERQAAAVTNAVYVPDRRVMADPRTQRALLRKGFAYSTWPNEGDHSYGFAGGFFLYEDISDSAILERLNDV